MPLEEKIEILIFLCADDDAAIRDTAFKTLQTWNAEEIKQVLSSPATPLPLLDFAVGYLAPGRKEVQEGLLQNPQLPEDLREWVRSLAIRSGEVSFTPGPSTLESESQDPARVTLLQRISRMSTAEKIKLALIGSQEERLLLIRDANRIVARAVLQSPKISEQEVENMAGLTNVSEEVLRIIGSNRKFLKNYTVVHTLVNNPRAPVGATMRFVNRLNDRDLKALSINKNVPEVLRAMAIKMIRQKIEAQKVKIPTKH